MGVLMGCERGIAEWRRGRFLVGDSMILFFSFFLSFLLVLLIFGNGEDVDGVVEMGSGLLLFIWIWKSSLLATLSRIDGVAVRDERMIKSPRYGSTPNYETNSIRFDSRG